MNRDSFQDMADAIDRIASELDRLESTEAEMVLEFSLRAIRGADPNPKRPLALPVPLESNERKIPRAHSLGFPSASEAPTVRPVNGRKSLLDRQNRIIAFVKSKGQVSKRDIAEEFNVPESDAYQWLRRLAQLKRLNHIASDGWAAIEK